MVIGGFLLLSISSCKSDKKPKYEDFDEDEFVMTPAIVTKITRAPVIGNRSHYWWRSINVYYAYNLDSDTVLVGKEMDVNLALKEGDGFYILVHKDDKDVSFVAGQRLLLSDQKMVDGYLKKSKEHGVKYYGVDKP